MEGISLAIYGDFLHFFTCGETHFSGYNYHSVLCQRTLKRRIISRIMRKMDTYKFCLKSFKELHAWAFNIIDYTENNSGYFICLDGTTYNELFIFGWASRKKVSFVQAANFIYRRTKRWSINPTLK